MRIISGALKGQRLPPPPEGTRPTSDRAREMLFNILAHNRALKTVFRGFDKTRVLDVFAGAGTFGFEALSRGALEVGFIDHNLKAVQHIRDFATTIKEPLGQVHLFHLSALSLPGAPHPFHLLFLDPPYGHNLLPPALLTLDAQGWIAPGACLIMETQAKEVLPLPSFCSLMLSKTCGNACFHLAIKNER